MRIKPIILAVGLILGATLNPGHAGVQTEDANALTTLASEQATQGLHKEAEIAYRKALGMDPLNTGALKGLFALYRQQGMAAKAQLTLAQLTSAQRDALGDALKGIESSILQEQADLRLAKGQDDKAIAFLEQAVLVDADDLRLHIKLSDQYARRHSYDKGQTLLEEFSSRHPDDADALYALAQYQSDRNDTAGALSTLNRIEAAKRSPAMNALRQQLSARNLIRDAQALVQAGKQTEAHTLLAEAEAMSPGNEALTVAFAWAEIGEVGRGRALYERVQASHAAPPDFTRLDIPSRRGLILILQAPGPHARAKQQLDAWAAEPSAQEIATGSNLAGLYAELGEYDRAKQLMDSLLVAHPEASYVLYDAWKMAQRTGHPDDEIDYLKKLVIAEPAIRAAAAHDAQPSPPPDYATAGIGEFGSDQKIERDWKEKKLAALIDQRSRWFSAAMDVRNRTGTAGLSEIHSVEIPLEYKTPWHIDDEILFRADLISLNAGSVAVTDSDFGSMLLCQPACTAASLAQKAQGVSLTAGYQRGDDGADIGITPPSFPVSNIVGGIRHKGDLGPFGYTLEASRRPITASLLSYAGSRDPGTGKVWGGVVATGARLGLSLDSGETFGFWSSLGLHGLTGRNVQTNRRIQLMAGEQWRIINEENRRFVLGLTGMYWDFSENAGEYSYGHGGYYSPDTYLSLSLPVTYTARSPRYSWMLRAAVSVSRSKTASALLYPTDSAMQTQAATLLAPAQAIYSAGSGNGRGYALKGAGEYQLTPRLFFGGILAIDRSESYAPNQALFYLRYSLDHPGARPVFMPPEPVEPSSQFY